MRDVLNLNIHFLGMLQNMSAYDLSSDYIAEEEQIIGDMTLEQHKYSQINT